MCEIIKRCLLFKSFDFKEYTTLLKQIDSCKKSFYKNEIVALEDSDCSSIGLVLKGSVEIQKVYESGKTITIERLTEGDIFGEVIVFSNRHTYPATIVAAENCEILFITKDDILKLCKSNAIFLQNFMTLLSEKILVLNRKLKIVSYKTLRQKIAHILLEKYHEQKNLKIKLDYTKKEMAQSLGVERPSLSRELLSLKNEGIIDLRKDVICILDIEKLENILLN